MTSLMYDQSSVLIVAVLLVAMVLGIEAGSRIGQRVQARVSESTRGHMTTVQASMLGILALLLGFTFAQSLDRFDARSAAVVDEANAIGTAYLRAQLAPPSVREPAQNLLRDYLALRIQEAAIALNDPREESLVVKAQKKHAALWQYAQQAAAEDSGPVTSGLFIQSINELIDSFGRREAEITRHVPELVMFLVMFTCVMLGAVVGFASGAEGHRPSPASYVFALLIVLLLFVIIDLDRPRRGFIEVPHGSLIDLQTTIRPKTKAES